MRKAIPKILITTLLCTFIGLSLSSCGGSSNTGNTRTFSGANQGYNTDDLYRFFAVAFGAAPGVTYMGQLIEAAEWGLSIKEIVNIFTTKPQFTDTYPLSMSNIEFATKLVNNVVGASANELAKQEAINDIVSALSLPNWTRGDVIYAVFNNLATKPESDGKWFGTAKKMANQVVYAKYYTETMRQDSLDLTTLRSVIATVNQNSSVTSNLNDVITALIAKPDAPVAIAPAVYAQGPYVMIDGSQSYDPANEPLTFNWSVTNPPAGWSASWGGFVDQTTKGTVAFYTYVPDGNFHGSFNVTLTVSNGKTTSAPLNIPVTLCCSPNDTVANAINFVAKLPAYSIDKIKSMYAAYGVNNWQTAFKFAASYGLSYPQLDFLKNEPPGTSLTEWRVNGPSNPYTAMKGGATIEGYSLNFPKAISVPIDLDKIKYPDDFSSSRSTTINVPDPFCNDNPSSTNFYAADLGNYTLPTISTVALPSGVLKLANIKDIWDVLNPSIGESCTKDVSVAWNVTLDRLVKVGVNAISITPWSFFYSGSSTWTLPVAGTDSRVSQMTDEDIKWIVGLAKARGLKVYWVNQIQGVIRPNGSFYTTEETTKSDVEKAVAALKIYLAERGSFFKSAGIDGVIMGSWYWVNFGTYLGNSGLSSANVEMINALRQQFKGEIIYSASNYDEITTEMNAVIDKYIYNQYLGFNDASIANFSVAIVKTQYTQSINAFLNAIGGKPLIFDTTLQSRAGYFTYSPGYYDPFCTGRGNNSCIQTTLAADYSMQAIFTQAVLESAATTGQRLGGIFMAYFVSPNLLPPSSFYNQDATVRGKPAEYIHYKWFNQ